ncbi:MAG: tail fiber domain-containing protein [Blastochloris viridis]|uniref:Tail fiber domain-containing protein n=1 Tax=Blastochloris viridis TaxID=1079 RepID=A0A6N4RCD0_BLAVI|nr:MAG: tail fiber domain-containing protein [Blastochloris viridis]
MFRTVLFTLITFLASSPYADDWGAIATISSTMGVQDGRLCLGETTRGDIGCPGYTPSVNAAGHVSVTGNLSAAKLLGDGSGLTRVPATDSIISATTGITAQSGGVISITTNGTTANYFDTAGRLVTSGISVTTANGISSTNGYFSTRLSVGTPSPQTNDLYVASANSATTAFIANTVANQQSYVVIGNTAENKSFSLGYIPNSNNPLLVFNYDSPIGTGVTRMTLTNTGRLGLGTTAPRAMLESTSGGIFNQIALGVCPFATCVEAGNTWPYETMQLTDGTNLRIFFGANQRFIFGNTGNAEKPGGGSWAALSDKRLKDIDGTYTHGLKEIAALNPVRFHYKKGNALTQPSDREYVGLIAQEVQPHFPEAVSKGQDGYYRLDTTPINFAVINALKELKAENDALRQEVERLKQKVDTRD